MMSRLHYARCPEVVVATLDLDPVCRECKPLAGLVVRFD